MKHLNCRGKTWNKVDGCGTCVKNIAPLFVMCDPNDIHVVPQVKAAHNEKPTIFFYDRYPGGIGLSEKIYDGIETILKETRNMVSGCPCEQGCPSCIGCRRHSKKQLKRIATVIITVSVNFYFTGE